MNPILNKKSFWGGLIFIAVGLLLLLQNFHLLPFVIPAYVFTWKMLLVAIGLFILPSRNWFGGLILISIGTYFLLPDLGIYDITIAQLWPMLLVVLGFIIIFHKPHVPKKKMTINTEKTMNGYIENTVIFGGESKKISSYDFKGGRLSVTCGGLELDLTNCTLSKERNIIDINVVFGGISLRVPREWNVVLETSPVMSGIEDDINYQKDQYVDPAAELVIRGSVVMGGLEIKRA